MNASPPTAAPEPTAGRAWALAGLAAAAVFAVIAPTLSWQAFTNGNENIVTQTALEIRRGGPAVLPELMGEPRVKKPPLAAWATAASMRPATVDRLNDSAAADAAYRELAWQVRWPALAAGCVMVLAAFEFARVWAGTSVAVVAALATATNYLFLKYLRQGTADAYLAAWVTLANACLAHGLLRGRWRAAATLGAAAVGVAFLCKGPVALAQTVLPAGVMAAVLHARRPAGDAPGPTRRFPWAAVAVGTLTFAAVAVPWFAYAWLSVPDVLTTWKTEVGREGATNLDAGDPLLYLALGPFMTPWAVFGAVGVALLWRRRGERAAWTAAAFVVVPLTVMVLFRDRKERYLLPMVGPAAAVCAYGFVAWARGWAALRTRTDRAVLAGHAAIVVGLAVALPVAGATTLRTADGGPWFAPATAAGVGGAVVAAAVVVAWQVRRGRPGAVAVGTAALTLGSAVLWFHGYARSAGGQSPLKPLADAIRAQAPGAAVYDWLPRGRADEQLAVYLGRTIRRADPAALPPGGGPAVMIARQARHDPPPQLPADWRPLATAKEGAATWYAFVRR